MNYFTDTFVLWRTKLVSNLPHAMILGLASLCVFACNEASGNNPPPAGDVADVQSPSDTPVVPDVPATEDTTPTDTGQPVVPKDTVPTDPDTPTAPDTAPPPPTGCDACGPGFQCIDDVCVCEPSPHFQEKDGACLPSCGALVGIMNWGSSTCCAKGCADAAQAPNTSWECDYCCPGDNSCVDSQQPPDCTPATCESLGVECGSAEDGCGKTLYCGPCSSGEDCELPPLSAPGVGLQNRSLVDDSGPYLGLGASLFWAAWGYKNDMTKLKANLQFLADNGFNYIRALGVVGCVNDPNDPSDYWADREIKVSWPDYNEVIAGLTDLAYDQYGLRIEWTLIGDGQCTVPTTADKYDLINRFLTMSQGREQKIVHFEIANEAWQNGFGGNDGQNELREMSAHMRANTDILVAASAPPGHECQDAQDIYDGCIADIATIHFDRDIQKTEGSWRPVRQPWEHQYCSLPVGSNNEPIGPGASVNTEHDSLKLVSGAIVTYISGLPLHVFHSNAGVRGDQDIWEMSGATSFSKIPELLPPDLSSWKAVNAHWSDSPFQVFAGDKNGNLHPDEMWVDYDDPTSGVVRAYGAIKDNDFVAYPMGIKGSVTMAPRKGMDFAVIDPITGATQECHSLAKDQQFTLTGVEAALIKGSFWCNGTPCGPACVVSAPAPSCGDNKCAPGVEDCKSCPGDCPCPNGKSCNNTGQCV